MEKKKGGIFAAAKNGTCQQAEFIKITVLPRFFKLRKKIEKKNKKKLAGNKKHRMFAAAKNSRSVGSGNVHVKVVFYRRNGRENFPKKNRKSFVELKKGFYICTRLTRKRVEEREKKFIDILN
ncbi:hypothetical protein ABI125_04160 [Tamlana crocina]